MKLLSHVACAVALAISSTAVFAADFAGTFADGSLNVQIIRDGEAYRGTIKLGGNEFPLQARDENGKLVGSFSSQGSSFNFSADRTDAGLTLSTDGATYNLRKAAAKNPLAGLADRTPEQATGGLGKYDVVTKTDSGKLLATKKENVTSMRDAIKAAVADITATFDGAPRVGGAYEDVKEKGVAAAPFSGNINGDPVKGVINCRVSDGVATITVMYAAANAPAAEWVKLGGGGGAAGAPPKEIALQNYNFPDGTGSIGIAEGWNTQAQSCMQGFQVKGPSEQTLTVGMALSVVTPNSTSVQMQLQMEANARQWGMQPPPRIPMLVAPFTEPADALQNLVPQLSQMSQSKGGPAIAVDNIEVKQQMQANLPGGRAQLLSYGATKLENGQRIHRRAMAQIEVAPISNESWMLWITEAVAPDDQFDRDYPVMLAMAKSFRTNDAVVQQKGQENLANQKAWFENQQRNHKEQMAAFDAQNKSWADNQKRMDKSHADFIEVIRGTREIENTTTGERTTVDLGNSTQIVDKLNEVDPGRYREIPLRDDQ